jgi:transposase
MTKNRTYKPQLKAQAVLQVLSGSKSAAQICRDLNINENLLSRWKQQLLTHAALVFERESEASEKDQRTAELERLVGKLTMELEIAKKASQLLSLPAKRNGRS